MLDPAGAVAGRLQMPAGIRAPGAPAQGTPVAGQPQVVGVEIGGVELLRLGGTEAGQMRQLEIRRDVVFALGLGRDLHPINIAP